MKGRMSVKVMIHLKTEVLCRSGEEALFQLRREMSLRAC